VSSAAILIQLADDVLRGETTRAEPVRAWRGSLLQWLILAIVVFGMLYGGAMGSYAGAHGPRAGQVVYSAVKVPILLVVTFLLSLPSFLVTNTLFGLRNDLFAVLRALLATQAGLTVILCSLGPFTLFWYVSGSDYQTAILFNGLMFAIASLSAQWLLRREYAPLVRANPRHRYMLYLWLFIYIFVGIQMAWVLRPFIGDPQAPVQFFREGSWSNAYEAVFEMIWNELTRKPVR
jgi:hypothetical protein